MAQMMVDLKVRGGVLLACLLASGVVFYVLRQRVSGEIAEPPYRLSELPMELGEWHGEDLQVLPETIEVLRAHDHVDRVYTNAHGAKVGLHIANWVDPELGTGAPHHPEICYPNAGWQIIERRSELRKLADGQELPVEWILHEHSGQMVVTAHFFRLGKLYFTQSGQLGMRVSELWGLGRWPFTEKILLQGDFPTIELAQPVMGDLVSLASGAVMDLED
jgi:EpsI family protein